MKFRILFFLLIPFICFAQNEYQTMDSLKMWYEGDSVTVAGSGVSAWHEKSGNVGVDGVMATDSKRPTLETDATSGTPVLRFDGSDDELTINHTVSYTDRTYFVVAKDNGAGGGSSNAHLFISQASSPFYNFGSFESDSLVNLHFTSGDYKSSYKFGSTSNLEVMTVRCEGGAVDTTRFWHNSSLDPQVREINLIAEATTWYLGSLSTFYQANADIAEILFYNRALTDAEVDTVNWNLRTAYSINQTYYVDADEGSDSNNGASITTAWQTISKLNGFAFFVPGDIIYFRTGKLWREQLIVPISGLVNLPLTFSAYDSATGLTGSATVGAKPIIDCSNPLTAWDDSTTYGNSGTIVVAHETGELAEYDATGTDGGDLSVTDAAALAGSDSGMQALVDDQTEIYGEKDISWTGRYLRVRFYFDPNGIQAAGSETDHVIIASFENPAERAWIGFYMEDNTTDYTIKAGIRADDISSQETSYYAITDGPHYIEVLFTKASSAVASDGSVQLWIDGVSKETKGSLDVYDISVATDLRLGIGMGGNGIDVGTTGTIFLDELVINYTTGEIGPANYKIYYDDALSTDPNQVFEDGVRMDEVYNIGGLLDSTNAWFWSAGNTTVFVRTSGDDTTSNYTIEASVRARGISPADGLSYITIDNIDIRKARFWGIRMDSCGSGMIVQNSTITNSYWHNVSANDSTTHMIVDACSLSWSGGNGIHSVRSDSLTATNNVIFNNSQLDDDGNEHQWVGGIRLWGMNLDYSLIENNKVYFNGRSTDGTYVVSGSRGHGIHLDRCNNDGPDHTIRYNNVYGNADFGIMLEYETGDADVYYNLVYDNRDEGIQLYRIIDSCLVANNVIYNNGKEGLEIHGDGTDSSMVYNRIINNISFGNTGKALKAAGGADNGGSPLNGYDNVYTNNMLGAEAANFIEWGLTVYLSTYAQFDSAHGSATNSVAGDPLFTDAASNDFTLQTTPVVSPAIDAGTDVNLVLDFDGNIVPFNTIPDIGAFESQVSLVTGYQKRYKRFTDYWRYRRY